MLIMRLAIINLGPYQPSNEVMLKFYGYYKQATEGPCNDIKPNFWDVIRRAKWEAWHKLGTMEEEEAMTRYVDELKQVHILKIFSTYKELSISVKNANDFL